MGNHNSGHGRVLVEQIVAQCGNTFSVNDEGNHNMLRISIILDQGQGSVSVDVVFSDSVPVRIACLRGSRLQRSKAQQHTQNQDQGNNAAILFHRADFLS